VDSPVGREGNRTDTQEEANRRAAERRLLRENNPLANLEAITQRLGREAAERFRIMIEERKEQTVNRVTSRVDLTWLRAHLTLKEIDSIEDKNASHVRNIINWYGPL
jgi:hypothetical protein